MQKSLINQAGGSMSRIGLFMAAALATVTLGAGVCAAGQLVVVTPGGIFEKALKQYFFEPFAKAESVDVVSVSSGADDQWAKLKAMEESGHVEWDLVNSSPDESIRYRDMLEPIDCSKLPNVENFGLPGTCSSYGIIQVSGGGVMVWNTDKYPRGHEPKSWADFWDQKNFPGTRSLMDNGEEGWMMMIALMADGVPADKLFPLDLDRATRKLEELKPNIVAWWKSGDQSQNLMRSGEADMAILWSGRAISLMREGVHINFTWNQALRDPGVWSIPKNAPHKDEAMKFLDFFMTDPAAHLAFSKQIVYDTSNKAAADMVPEADKPFRASTPANWNAQAVPDWQWIAAHQDELQKRFAQVLAH